MLSHESKIQDQKFHINQQIDPLKQTLIRLKTEFDDLTRISENKQHWDNLDEKLKIDNEKAKILILEQVHKLIEKQYGKPDEKHNPLEPVKADTPLWRYLVLVFLLVADITLMSIGGYVGSIELLQFMVPDLDVLIATMIAAIATAIEGFMIYSMLKPWLQQGLGIAPDKSKETLAEQYGNRLALTVKMNSMMENNPRYTAQQGPVVYQYHVGILKSFNKDMKKVKLLPFEEPTFKKVGRYALSIINLVLSLAGTYFGTVIFLTAIAATLVGTPAGWGIIALFIVAQLLSRFLIRGSSLYTLLNPTVTQHEKTIGELNKFEDKSDGLDKDLEAMEKINVAEKMSAAERSNKAQDREKGIEDLQKPNPRKPLRTAECPSFFKFKPEEFLADSKKHDSEEDRGLMRHAIPF